MPLQQFEFHVERLEHRKMMAGNVEADVRGGTLFVDGDNLGNQITISRNGGIINIEGEDGTTVNGVDMLPFTGVTRNVVVRMRDGYDLLTMRDLDVGGFLSVNAGTGGARLMIEDSTVSGDVRMTTGTADTGIWQQMSDNVIGGRITVRNGAVDATQVHHGVSTHISGNDIGRGIQIRQGNTAVTNVDLNPCCGTRAASTIISGNSISAGGVRITAGKSSLSQPTLYTTGHVVFVGDSTTITGGISVRLGSTDVSNGFNDAVRVDGHRVSVRNNLLVDGNVNIRVGNATVTGDEMEFLRGNLTSIGGNGEITGNVIVRQGSATAVGSADVAVGNRLVLADNSISGQANVFNGDAEVVSDVAGFAFALGIHNTIDGNEAERIRITNQSASSSSPASSGGILTEFSDNSVSRDVFISDGNAAGDASDAVVNLSDSSIDGRLNYVGRNGNNLLSLDSMEVLGRVLARAGNGDDSFGLINSTFESIVRLDGAAGAADVFNEFGVNTFQAGSPILIGIEIGA